MKTLLHIYGSLVIILVLFGPIHAKTDSYWDSVKAVQENFNFYKFFNISNNASLHEIQKAFRIISMKYHPDRSNNKQDTNIYVRANTALQILSDEAKRREYDQLLKNGIPFFESYRFRTYRTPSIDSRLVILGIILILTAVLHILKWSNYHYIIQTVKKSHFYKTKQNLLNQKVKAKKSVAESEEEQGLEPDINIYIEGAERPTVYDLLPILILRAIYRVITSIFRKKVSKVESFRRFMEKRDARLYTLKDAILELRELEQQRKKFLNSTKFKRVLRYQKKNMK